ncbi:MAG: DinB family protein [Bacteroidetes bacterium]|nr:DinB family protein [Bacteroidota bacterium]
MNDFRNLPTDLENVVKNLNQNQLDTPYREDGWTVQQVVHHLADSHMNCYIYFKLTLTEDLPIIKDYNENDWSNTTDVLHTPISFSINLLYALHQRWADLLSSLSNDEWQKSSSIQHIK